ncbi:MAG: peptidylprolyl isomerase [Actinomycetota bacterium]|nr:peptidylprolyl isomerase [Actinomycetota bacterium]
MKRPRLLLATLGLALALAATACGGGGGVPDGAVAVVDGTEVSRAELDELIERAKKAYTAQKQEFPKVGTPEFQNVQTQYVTFLVQREEFEKEAAARGITVSEKDVDDEVQEFLKTRFDGKRSAFLKALKEQGFTEEALRDTLRTSVLSQKLFDDVTKDVKVEGVEILAYYQQNQAQYGTPESRDVRHILISEKKSGDEVDFPKSKVEADRIYAVLRGGGDFAALAKENSDDPSAKDNSGKLTITRGQTVPEFDKVAFELERGALSKPVKTTYGYHVIEALTPVKKATTTPIAKVRASIRATLLQEKRTTFMTTWVEDLKDEYDGKVSYATGFEPPDIPDATTTETETDPS